MFTLRRSRKGQIALEYLTTYGFALLVLLLTVGVISYLGFFDPSTLRSNECRFPSGLACRDYQVGRPSGTPELLVIVTNEYGVNLTLNSVDITANQFAPNTYVVCTYTPVGTWPFGQNKTFTCPLPVGSFVSGQRYDGAINVSFRQQSGSYDHQVLGTFSVVAQ